MGQRAERASSPYKTEAVAQEFIKAQLAAPRSNGQAAASRPQEGRTARRERRGKASAVPGHGSARSMARRHQAEAGGLVPTRRQYHSGADHRTVRTTAPNRDMMTTAVPKVIFVGGSPRRQSCASISSGRSAVAKAAAILAAQYRGRSSPRRRSAKA